MQKISVYILPIIAVCTVLQLDCDASRTHIVLVRVIIPLLGDNKRCIAIIIQNRTKIQLIICRSIICPILDKMSVVYTVEVFQLASGFPDIRCGVFRNAVHISLAKRGIAAKFQRILTILFHNGKNAVTLCVIPPDCKICSLRILYTACIIAIIISQSVKAESKSTVLNIF